MSTRAIAEVKGKSKRSDMATRQPESDVKSLLRQNQRPPSTDAALLPGQAPSESHLGHDFGQMNVYPEASVKSEASCPLASSNPTLCPFGGACHTCPAKIQTKPLPGLSSAMVPASHRTGGESVDFGSAAPGAQSATHVWTESSPFSQVVLDALSSPGRQLDNATRLFMEDRLDGDFSRVRLHTDNNAHKAARSVRAQAFTLGQDVVFGKGRYAPSTKEGRKLLAHELTHVVQQSRSRLSAVQRQSDDGAASQADEDKAEHEAVAAESKAEEMDAPAGKSAQKNPCTRTILAEGTCADLVAGSKYICCNPDNGIERKGKKTDVDGTSCPSEKFTPIFTCDNTCKKALEKGCDDNDNWMAVPGSQFNRSQCGDTYTICANGKQTQGYVRDKSETEHSFEVSPGIQTALGVTVGSSFKGAVYRPGAKQTTIDKDPCCKT